MSAGGEDGHRPISETARQTLTVAIPTKDVADLLADCLSSVAWADEIIVVDMFSSDDTEEVCARYPQCRFFQRSDYIFGNLNFAFEHATSDWVMRLDSDERITPELAEEIRAILANPPQGVAGYEFWERAFVLGRELRFGFGRKHYRKILFRRGAARYPVRHEHEDLDGDGVWLRGRNGYVHLNYNAVREYLTKANYYTELDVARAALPTTAPSQRAAFVSSARAFYLYYLKYQGFRDGWVGLLDASMRSVYQFVYWAKLRERWEREQEVNDAG
ncbi:MAG TPA: glycosyltransferase family 2 protein [Gaiellaceae bacterium]